MLAAQAGSAPSLHARDRPALRTPTRRTAAGSPHSSASSGAAAQARQSGRRLAVHVPGTVRSAVAALPRGGRCTRRPLRRSLAPGPAPCRGAGEPARRHARPGARARAPRALAPGAAKPPRPEPPRQAGPACRATGVALLAATFATGVTSALPPCFFAPRRSDPPRRHSAPWPSRRPGTRPTASWMPSSRATGGIWRPWAARRTSVPSCRRTSPSRPASPALGGFPGSSPTCCARHSPSQTGRSSFPRRTAARTGLGRRKKRGSLFAVSR